MKEIERAIIERAIEEIENIKEATKVACAISGRRRRNGDYSYPEELIALELAIQALQEKLDRQENKALTLRELKEMVGEPVYRLPKLLAKEVILEKVTNELDEYWVEQSYTDLKGDKRFVLSLFKDFVFYKHKPNGGE